MDSEDDDYYMDDTDIGDEEEDEDEQADGSTTRNKMGTRNKRGGGEEDEDDDSAFDMSNPAQIKPSGNEAEEDYAYEVLSAGEIVKHMGDCIKEVNVVLQVGY